MRLGLNVGYSGATIVDHLPLVLEAERLGYQSVWAAEAYGSDVVTPLAWYAARTESIDIGSAIMQMPARTPAMTAMTAATLSELSGGRFRLGLGLSGPQVVEGWHGEAYGKPLRLIVHPKHDIPLYLASIGPRNVALTAEIADGWLPAFYSPLRAAEVWGEHLAAGFVRSGEDGKADRFDVAVAAPAAITDDSRQARAAIKPTLALYVGGMGARGRNFYFDLACRYGYEAAAERIQQLYLEGNKAEAVAAVPDELVDETSLIGSEAEVEDRLAAWREAGVTTFVAMTSDVSTLRTLAELVL